MFHFPDSETGYYDDERSFFDHDRELELAELEREDRFEVEAEEMLANLWAGPVPLVDEAPIVSGTFAAQNHIDPETGCTAAEVNYRRLKATASQATHEITTSTLTPEGWPAVKPVPDSNPAFRALKRIT